MTFWVSFFVGGTIVVAAVALAPVVSPAGLLPAAGLGRGAALVTRLRAAQQHLIDDLGRSGAAVMVYSAALGVTTAICWVLGKLAHPIERFVDVPVFDSARAGAVSWLTGLNKLLTLMGNRPEVKPIALAAAVVLAVWYRRRWWVPVLAIGLSFVVEFYLQHMLALAVDRGHPPTTLGTWPSGGCARLVSMYGLIIWLYLHNRVRGARRSAAALWGLLVVLAWLEGFSRTYLLKHWFTDVLGGWIFGGLLLAASIALVLTIDGRSPRRTDEVPAVPHQLAAGTAQPEGVRG